MEILKHLQPDALMLKNLKFIFYLIFLSMIVVFKCGKVTEKIYKEKYLS